MMRHLQLTKPPGVITKTLSICNLNLLHQSF